MVENRQWAAPHIEQALELAQGILPREFQTWEEVPGWLGASTSPQSAAGSTSSGETLPGQLTLEDA
jgi:hypothetical protein